MLKKLRALDKSRYACKRMFNTHYNAVLANTKNMVLGNLIYYPLGEMPRAIKRTEKCQAVFEYLINELNMTDYTSVHVLPELFEKHEWEEMNKEIKANKEKYLQLIDEETISADKNEKIILGGAQKLLEHLCSSDETLLRQFKNNTEKQKKTIFELTESMAKVSCKALYIKACLEILIGNNPPNIDSEKNGRGDSVCQTYKEKLYEALKNDNLKLAKYYANELYLSSEMAAMEHAYLIHTIQKARINADESERKFLMEKELSEIILMNSRINDYAAGLYFYSVPVHKLVNETKYARKLDYKEDITPLPITDIKKLTGNFNEYLDKKVRIRGTVGHIDEKKWFVSGKEAVKTEFKVQNEQNEMLVVLNGHLLRDNGLEADELIDVTGIAQENSQGTKFIKLLSRDLYDIRNQDWLSRTLWIAGDWWDNGTDNTDAYWTLNVSLPPQFALGSMEFVPPQKKEEMEQKIKDLKRQYIPLRAAIWANKKSYTLIEKIETQTSKSINKNYVIALAIDRLIALVIKN